jgi:hypothetical protein
VGTRPGDDAPRREPAAGDRDRIPDDLRFRSAAAPGLDEDDLFIALMVGSPVSALWGDGRSWPVDESDRAWDEERERRRRHERLMRTWDIINPEIHPE